MHLPERDILAIGPGINRTLRHRGLGRSAITQQFGAPSIEDLVHTDSVPNRQGTSTVRSYEYVPGFSLIVVIVARDRYSSPQVSDVVIPFASHIKPNQVTRAHILIQMIVPSQRGKRAREYSSVSGHCPRPE